MRMVRLSALMRPTSGDWPVKYSGWLTMYWSMGSEEATSTPSERLLRRPARPMRCQVEEIEPG